MTLPGPRGLAPPLRVRIDLTPAVQGHGGIGRYAFELARALVDDPAFAGAVELSGWVVDRSGRAPAAPLDALPCARLARTGKAWRAQLLAASFLARGMDRIVGSPDVFHATDHVLPPLSRTAGVLTVHDLSFLRVPDTHLPLLRTYMGIMMPRFVRAANAIVADSEATRTDVIDAYGVAPERVRTVHLGVGAHYAPRPEAEVRAVRTRLGLPGRYLLSVGTLEPRKNLRTLLAAFDAASIPGLALVLVGPRGWRLADVLPSRATSAALETRVLLPGFVAEEDLPALYTGCEAFCFPSVFEGFGLPVLEAMACGAPVLASDATSLPEVVGDAGVLLPPLDRDAWAEALRALAVDPDRRARLGAAARARAARFPWRETARGTLAAYREARARRA